MIILNRGNERDRLERMDGDERRGTINYEGIAMRDYGMTPLDDWIGKNNQLQ